MYVKMQESRLSQSIPFMHTLISSTGILLFSTLNFFMVNNPGQLQWLRPWQLQHPSFTDIFFIPLIKGCCSVTKLCLTLHPHELQHARLPCPLLSLRVCSNACSLSQWCHQTISSSVAPFSFGPQSFPASGSFPVSQLLASGGQSIGSLASASVLSMNIQDWFSLGLICLISFLFKGLSRVFCRTTV